MIKLRPHQQRTIDAVRAAFGRKVKRVVIVAPTGFGKTATASTLIVWAVAKKRRVLFVVHRKEIVRDTHRRLVKAGVTAGLIMADEVASEAPVQVASVQTICARDLCPEADLVVWDECHHNAAESYKKIAAKYPNAWHLGLTATPERADGQGLRDAFDELVVGATVAELQSTINPETGHPYLASCDVINPPKRLDGIAQDPVKAWQEHAQGRPTVVFCRSVAESKALALAFEKVGVVARHISSDSSAAAKTARDKDLEAFARGEVTVLTNVFVLTEGWDAPRAKVCVIARGCGSEGTFLQMVGRVLREHEGERALLIDLSGVVIEHGLPEEERDFSLDGIKRRPKKDREWLRQCQGCGAVVKGAASGPECARCGDPWPAPPPTKIAQVKLQAYSAGSHATRAQRRADFEALMTEAFRLGYDAKWAGCRFKEKHGFWPKGLA